MPESGVHRARKRYDVAIIGYGPVGATLANLLGQAGVSVIVLERDAGIYPMPRAIHFDGEVMRIFQSIGLKQEVEGVSRPGARGMHFVNAAGKTMLVRGGNSANGPHACANNYYFHQPQLEAVLREGVGRFPNVKVYLGQDVLGLEQQPDGVRLRVQGTNDGAQHEVEVDYVVGCDGARSLVRRAMGTEMEDLGLHQPWLVFDVLLKRNVDLPDHTVQHCDPARPMTYCNVVGNRRRWEIMLLPGDDPASIAKPENVWPLVSRWINPQQATLERCVVYTFHSVIARGWRKDRLLLAGDSAHQTPPFLGQGMCAGVRDASNLAWKLALVVRGEAPDSLLDTYESEREPHVRAFIDLAVKLGDIIQTTDVAVAAERDRQFESDQGGEPKIFLFPSPPLGAGLHDDAPPPVATPFHQPRLDDGRLLDDAIGLNFAVIGTGGAIGGVSAATRALWREAGVAVLSEPGSEAVEWLRTQAAAAVLIRPDRYIMGVAQNSADLDRLSAMLPRARVGA
jgi:3-(3-hydroxy-phenyl)propionate hydroxylase